MTDYRHTQPDQRSSGRRRQKSSMSSQYIHLDAPDCTVEHPPPQTYLTIPTSRGHVVGHDDLTNGYMDFIWSMPLSVSEKDSYDNGTDCAITDDTNSSWLVVQQQQHQHHRTSSNGSSGGVSESPCLSIPSDDQPEWVYDTAGTTDQMYQPTVNNSHQLFLPDLSGSEPQPSYMVCQSATGSEEVYQEHTDNYGISQTYVPGTSHLPFESFKPSDGAEPSWNPLEHRVPRYDPGYASFAPLSPSESLLNEAPLSSSENGKTKSSEKKARASRPMKSAKGRSKSKSTLGWEHTVVRKGGLERVFEYIQAEPSQKRFGVRKGKLQPETKEKVRRVRQVHACWTCWVLKVPCSEGDICNRCMKQASKCSPIAEQLCSRAGFIEYEDAFFPPYLHSHFERGEIKTLVNNHTIRFTDHEIVVEVRTGQSFEPMTLLTHVFQPKDKELLESHHVTPGAAETSAQLVCQYSAPVAMMAFSLSDMKTVCKDHIKKMIKSPTYALQTTAGDPTSVPYFALEAILKYYSATESPLLHNAMMLHACHYFMAHLVTFSEETAEKVHLAIDPYAVPPDGYLSSRLLNRQIKYAVHKLHREILRDVLEGLEKSMRTRTKDSWGASFCTILLLCVCMEELQTAADTFVICDIEKSKNEGTTSHYDRNLSFNACQTLDDYPFQQSAHLFHDIYRSHRELNSGGREGFNPLRSLQAGVETGLDEPTNTMTKEIYFMLNNLYPEMRELAQKPTMVNNVFQVEPSDIKVNNTGRLVSKFLMSFFPAADSNFL